MCPPPLLSLTPHMLPPIRCLVQGPMLTHSPQLCTVLARSTIFLESHIYLLGSSRDISTRDAICAQAHINVYDTPIYTHIHGNICACVYIVVRYICIAYALPYICMECIFMHTYIGAYTWQIYFLHVSAHRFITRTYTVTQTG